ncbi:prepilin-type N-terminal cleavage/methylation domain-containing protein [Candidatus Parcubacteria bacterium]|nr:prepilin-type N-terminal cleavage/methylation domain-containing protein [Candidatus Parcubacteria bacterium]
MNIFKKTRGFTLIELLVVIAIIGILASVIIANVSGSKSKGRDAKRVADIKNIQVALELYYNDNGFYPLTVVSMVPTYIPIEPKDPTDNTTPYKYSAVSTIAGGNACVTTPSNRNKYHLAAVMENNSQSNTALGQDVDYDRAAYSHFACSGTGADFHGNANNCTGTTGTSPNENCYDVTN